MAQIDEERVIVRVSQLIRDSVDVNASTVVDETIRSEIEEFAQNLLGEAYLVETEIVTYVPPQ
jgi:hypothetical protein